MIWILCYHIYDWEGEATTATVDDDVAVYINVAIVAANADVLLKRTRYNAVLVVVVIFVVLYCEKEYS